MESTEREESTSHRSLVILSKVSIVWGILCVVTGAVYFENPTAVVDIGIEKYGEATENPGRVDVFFIIYGFMAMVPPIGFFYSRSVTHSFAGVITLLFTMFIAYTFVGSIIGGLFAKQLKNIPPVMMAVLICIYIFSCVPVALIFYFCC